MSHKTGGVGIFIKESFAEDFIVLNCADHCKKCKELCEIPNILWLMIGEVLFVVAYINPEGSRYVDEDIFDKMTYYTLELSDHFSASNICIMGDFNARTGDLIDYVHMDDLVLRDNPNVPDIVKDCLVFPSYDIDVIRTSKDDKVNNWGRNCIQFCQNLDVRLVNGLYGVNSSLPTCKNLSVVDYFALSPGLFSSIVDMKVKTFDPLLSDVHNVIELRIHPTFLNCNMECNTEDKDNTISCKYVWSNDKKDEFMSKLNATLIQEVVVELDMLLLANTDFSCDVINNVNEKICKIFSEAASESNMSRDISKPRNPRHTVNKKWFDKECKKHKAIYKSNKNKYKHCKSKSNSDMLRVAGKNYKRSINNAVRKYEKKINKKLRTLKTDNPKEFWKLICTNEGSDINSKIHINVLAEYFANLNKDDNTYEEYEVQRSVDKSDFQNEFLNMPFHEDEIMSVLRSLKSGKSAGPDCLINAFFKMSRNSICGLFTKMFNAILKCGHIPETWSSGWIVPIYKNKGNKDDPNNYRGISLIN